MSSWLQEYLYYSLGGNRKGKLRTYFNLFLTMLLGGLWHGAAWTFVLWGAIHGFALISHKLFMQLKIKLLGDKNATNTLWSGFSMLLTFAFVSFCWIFFRADSFSHNKWNYKQQNRYFSFLFMDITIYRRNNY